MLRYLILPRWCWCCRLSLDQSGDRTDARRGAVVSIVPVVAMRPMKRRWRSGCCGYAAILNQRSHNVWIARSERQGLTRGGRSL
jgi:hypothetical protein